MHSFFVPSLGVQIYATPGRINETWMKVDKPGVYYGQCNQICGKDHAYMPIAVEALDKAAFDRWLVDAKKKFASDTPSSRPAAAVSIASATHTNTR
jgi:cytochrome c oxidase subunit 2